VNHKEFALRREGESYVAIISCKVESEMTPDDIMEHLRAAVTAWVNQTADGKACYIDDTSQDLNIGDLDMHGIPPAVIIYLGSQGIRNFKVQIFGGEDRPTDYHYDSHLYGGQTPTADDIPTEPMRKFFEVEQRNAGVATLNTAMASFVQAPTKVMRQWCGVTSFDRDAFRIELEWLIALSPNGGDTTLDSVLAGKAL